MELKINNVMPKIVRCDHTVLIANIDIKWKRFSAKIAPKTVHIGLAVRMSILDTKGRRFEPQHQYVFSLSKRLYPHCFSRLSCEMSTRSGQPREGCSVL